MNRQQRLKVAYFLRKASTNFGQAVRPSQSPLLLCRSVPPFPSPPLQLNKIFTRRRRHRPLPLPFVPFLFRKWRKEEQNRLKVDRASDATPPRVFRLMPPRRSFPIEVHLNCESSFSEMKGSGETAGPPLSRRQTWEVGATKFLCWLLGTHHGPTRSHQYPTNVIKIKHFLWMGDPT